MREIMPEVKIETLSFLPEEIELIELDKIMKSRFISQIRHYRRKDSMKNRLTFVEQWISM